MHRAGSRTSRASATYHARHAPNRRRRRLLAHPLRIAPHVVGAAAIAAVATPATAVAWVSALATGRVPRPVERIVTRAHEHFAAVNGTLYLLTEDAPPPPWRRPTDHPVRLRVAPGDGRVARRDALRRLAVAPPIVAADVLLGAWVLIGTGAAAAAVLGTGTMPRRAHRAIAFGTSYHARSAAYLALISDVVPGARERDLVTGQPRTPGSGGA